MACYKPQERNNLLVPVVLSEQVIPGSFAFVLNYLVDHELGLSTLDAHLKNDETGAIDRRSAAQIDATTDRIYTAAWSLPGQKRSAPPI